MMEFDFGSLSVPGKEANEIEPRAILRSLPVGPNGINDLWDGQARALAQWHERRTTSDNVILLNTGAGKSIVGLLIAESLRRENRGNVIYMCANNDLVLQVAKEASRIGLQHTTRIDGRWSNTLFQQSKAICITNYQAVLQPYTVFKGEIYPSSLILDDAHVAEGIIRDQLTLRVTHEKHKEFYQSLKAIIVDQEPEGFWKPKLTQVASGGSAFGSMMCSPLTGLRHEAELDNLFSRYVNGPDLGLTFPLGHVQGKWRHCAFLVGRGVFEITPPILPTLALQQFADASIKRVYLSATLDQGVDFARAFGRQIKAPIRPDVDAGNGERLILFSNLMGGPEQEAKLVGDVVENSKLLIAVPSGRQAERWSALAKPPSLPQFSAALEAFRAKSKGVFLLVGRYDGIDLPNETCRTMALDGVPRGVSLLEKFMWEYLHLYGDLRSRVATRITQLFGRIIRGRVDFGVFFILSNELNIWLSNDRNISLLPELLRKQLRLGQHVHKQLNIDAPEKGAALARSVLARQSGWSRFYADFINSSDVDASTIAGTLGQQEVIAEVSAKATRFWSALWNNDSADKVDRVRGDLEALLTPLAVADSRAAGWISIWLGTSYSIGGESASSADLFRQARNRLYSELPLPRSAVSREGGFNIDLASPLAKHFIDLFAGGIVAANGRVAAEDRALSSILDDGCSHSQFEEAVKTLGSCLGFISTRPDNEIDIGPDNLWSDGKACLGLEAKTNKKVETYSKDEIGQAHQHWEWMGREAGAGTPLALYLISEAKAATEGSSPNEHTFTVSRDSVKQLLAAYKDLREVMRAELGASRLSQMARLGVDDEWSLVSVSERLRPQEIS